MVIFIFYQIKYYSCCYLHAPAVVVGSHQILITEDTVVNCDIRRMLVVEKNSIFVKLN